MEKNDLKIEFRAVDYHHYYDGSRRIEYRISPDQDLTHEVNHSWFWGLIKFRTKEKYDTDWQTPEYFLCYTEMDYDGDDEVWVPFRVKTMKEFESYKTRFPTYGKFMDYIFNLSDENRLKSEKEVKDWY